MKFSVKNWVCLVSEADLDRKRSAIPHLRFGQSRIAELLWRQIELFSTGEGAFLLRLRNVNEDAVLGGGSLVNLYLPDGIDLHLAWQDIQDKEFVPRVLGHEQYVVVKRIEEMFEAARACAAIKIDVVNAGSSRE